MKPKPCTMQTWTGKQFCTFTGQGFTGFQVVRHGLSPCLRGGVLFYQYSEGSGSLQLCPNIALAIIKCSC